MTEIENGWRNYGTTTKLVSFIVLFQNERNALKKLYAKACILLLHDGHWHFDDGENFVGNRLVVFCIFVCFFANRESHKDVKLKLEKLMNLRT